jgi:hypothetical protein
VNVFTGLLSQALQGRKWRRAQRANTLNHGLSAIMWPQTIGSSTSRVGEQLSRNGTRQQSRYSPARQRVVHALTGLLGQARRDGKWRREQPVSSPGTAVWVMTATVQATSTASLAAHQEMRPPLNQKSSRPTSKSINRDWTQREKSCLRSQHQSQQSRWTSLKTNGKS